MMRVPGKVKLKVKEVTVSVIMRVKEMMRNLGQKLTKIRIIKRVKKMTMEL